MTTLRPTLPEDQSAIRHLLNAVWNGEEGAVAYHGGGRAPGVAAVRNGQIIGYASARAGTLHPTHTYIGVHVHPGERGKGVGTALWQAVMAGVSSSLKTALGDGDPAARRFLERWGLRVSVETYQPTLDPSQLDSGKKERWQAEAHSLGYEFLPMTELNSPELQRGVAILHAQVYAHSHQHDPPDWLALEDVDFLGDDLVPDWLWLARKDGVLAGVSSVRLTDSPMQGDLGWFGVSPAFARDGALLTLALTAAALQSAGQAGVVSVEAELDSADPNALTLWHALSWQPGRVWLTLTSEQSN